MVSQTIPSPDVILATNDPGDETARRYRYQWTYAAIICCMLLDNTEDTVEVFCEHHEDVLIKHNDGKFTGLQVKTRGIDQPVWKTSDESVRHACARFAQLEAQFPDHFRAFRFLSNHPLYASQNGQDLRYVLQNIAETTSHDDLPSSVASFLARIAGDAGCDTDSVFAALAKTTADDSLPKLADIEIRLIDTVTQVWNRATDCTYASVQRAVRHLTTGCGHAASLSHQDVLPAYLPATTHPGKRELTERLAAKRIDQSLVLSLLEDGLQATAILEGSPETYVEPGSGSTDLLLKKLDAGGFSAVSCHSALDLRDKADHLGIVWTKKYGRNTGLQRYGHVQSLVLRDAATAFEETKTDKQRFGVAMLEKLRSLLRQRRIDGSLIYECSQEHLEGFSYSLSSQCKIQWSLDCPWEVK